MRPTGTIILLPFVVLLLLVDVCYAVTHTPMNRSTTITYQAHSFDDLGEWRQLLAKGTTFIKVDLRYTLAEVCVTQPRVFNQDNRGCYLLSHDAPLANYSYYTAYDIVAFVIDPANKYLFTSRSHLYIYLDFKNNRDRYPPANLTQSDDLQMEYITFFTNQLRLHALTSIELVYDGIYVDEVGRMYNWPRTYGFSMADSKNPTSCFYSDNHSYKCKDTRIINNMANPLPFSDPSLSIYRLCNVSYGKFINSPYPMVFYEPTDQRTVLNILDAYLNCGIEHAGGIAVSINVDPVQYKVYAGTRSGKAWNERIFDGARWAHNVPIHTDGSTLAFLTLYLTKESHIVYTFNKGFLDVQSGNSNINSSFPFGAIDRSHPHFLPTRLPFATSSFQKLKTFTFSAGEKQYVFISDYRGTVGIYGFNNVSLVPIANTTLTHKQSESVTVIQASIIPADPQVGNYQAGWVEVEFLQAHVSYERTECTLLIQWWKLRFDPTGKHHSDLIAVGDSTCGVYSPFKLPLPVDSASIITTTTDAGASYCTPDSTHVGLIVISSHKKIFGGVLCANAQKSTVKVCVDSMCLQSQQDMKSKSIGNIPTLSELDVGTFPSLSIATLPTGEPVVLEVHGDGFCYNSDMNNKRSHPRVCESIPVSSRYVLNYNYGKLTSWANHIFSNSGMITSCDGAIFHGVYDEGSIPSAFMILDQQHNVRMVEAHTGFPNGAVDYAGCSWPVPYDGAIIDGIVLPQVSLMVGGNWELTEAVKYVITPNNNYDNNVFEHTGQVTLTTAICDICQAKFFDWQTKYQSDYELLHALAYKISDMCTLGQIFIGDGTVAGCKNLVLLYVPALAVDLARNIFSPANCHILGLCTGNNTNVLPDINGQLVRTQVNTPTRTGADTGASDASTYARAVPDADDQDATAQTMEVLRSAIKSQLLDLIGF